MDEDLESIPRIFNNCVNSIIFTNIQNRGLDLSNRFELIELYDLVDNNLTAILETDKCQIYCRKIQDYHIIKLIEWFIHFNTNDYKCNAIMKKIVYILYYYIQDRKNVMNLYEFKFNRSSYGIKYLRDLLPNIQAVDPTIKKLLTVLIEEIDEYIQESRLCVLNVLNKELVFLPADLVNIISGYMSDLQVLKVAEMF